MPSTTIQFSVAALVAVGGGGFAATSEPPASGEPPAATGAAVSFVSPADGEHIAGVVNVTMAAEGVTIEPAGEVHDGAGHFHVIADRGCLAVGESIVKDADHVHFGGGQSEGMIYLEPGYHELCLQVGDGVHLASELTATVTVDVGVDNTDEWCTVVGQVDEAFDTVDNSDDEFAVKQLGYEGIRRLLSQLRTGLEYVDEDARAAVGASLAWATDLVNALIQADDEVEAEAFVTPVFDRMEEGGLPGADWILATCSVDING
jgi:hypothetical protein